MALLPHIVFAQNINDGQNPKITNYIYALVVKTDSKMLVGGGFTSVAGQTRNRLARLNADGSLDPGFADTEFDGDILAFE